jgi:iduronate 2-sulfatase
MMPIERNLLRFSTLFVAVSTLLLSRSSILAAEEPANSSNRKNVLLICIDDLRPELNCYGATYIRSPNIDGLASEAIRFTRHYVQAPTCGASRYALLTGRYGGPGNEALFQRAKEIQSGQAVPPSLPGWFRQHGYTSVAVGKVSHHPGGLGGADWDDPQQLEMPDSWDRQSIPAGPWLHPRGWMHGLANGEIRTDASQMDAFQATVGDDSIYPDGISIPEALREIDVLADAGDPFFLACGILRPHLPFGAPENYFTPYRDVQLPPIPHPQKPVGQTTWHSSAEFNRYQRWGQDPNHDADFADQVRKHYAACVSYADAQVGKLIAKLKQRGLWENTIVVLWGDHGWHLGEHAVWGKHTLFEESLRSPLLIRAPDLLQVNQTSNTVVQTVDLFPTLCELTKLPVPDFVAGRSLLSELIQPNSDSTETYAISYMPNARSIRSSCYRLIVHCNNHVELYDHDGEGESKNIAAGHPDLVSKLQSQLKHMQRLPDRSWNDD